jgi:hypothetical protein
MGSAYFLKRLSLFFFIVALCLSTHKSQAQQATDTTVLYRVITLDGNEYIGNILEQNEEFIQLRTQHIGTITLARKDIRSLEAIDTREQVGSEFWFANPQATRYFWQPNGYGLKRGEGYYQNVWILFNQASVGITDNFSIGAGMVPLFLFAGTATPAWITPKFSMPVVEDKFNLGGGALIGTILGEESTGFGLLYGIGTLGSRDRNASLGIGYGYVAGSLASRPTITFSGMYRTGKNGYLLTENYIISVADETVALLSFGGRRIIRSVGLDFGLALPFSTEESELFALPWLGLTVPFGNKVTQPRL